METLDHSDYDEEMKQCDEAFKAEFLKQYVQANATFLVFGVVVYAAQWLLQ